MRSLGSLPPTEWRIVYCASKKYIVLDKKLNEGKASLMDTSFCEEYVES